MITFLTAILIWFGVSIPVGIIVGHLIKTEEND